MSSGEWQSIGSSDDLESAIKKDGLVVIWVFDSDAANRGFGKKMEEQVIGEIKQATFYKAGTDDIADAMKKHKLSPDNVAFFKGGELLKEEREEHNLIFKTANSLL